MIHINVDTLRGPDFEAWQERAKKARGRALAVWTRTGKAPHVFSDSVWSDFKRDFLLDLHNRKCAYCESDISANADLHVEHYRPKAGVTVRTNDTDHTTRETIDHPGYFWLAYEWWNLILSCPFCNTYHATQEQKKRTTHPGKLNEFRVSGTRVDVPCANPERWLDQLAEERPLLLHPYFDYPENEIAFDDNGVPYPKNGSERGRETIEVCNLKREELNQARRDSRDCFFHRANALFEGRDVVVDPMVEFSAWKDHVFLTGIRRLAERCGYTVVLSRPDDD